MSGVAIRPMAALTVNSATRPARAIVFVPAVDGLEWQYPFIGALRAQTRVWGGQSNLPVPLGDGTFDHPALWALLRALDPDAVIVHHTAWLDLEDLKPERYAEYRDRTVEQLRGQGFEEPTIAHYLKELPDHRLTDRVLAPEEERLLLRRAPFLHLDHVQAGYTGGSGGPGHPFVDALKLRIESLPDPLAGLSCPFSIDGQLALAADGGQFSPAVAREIKDVGLVVGDTQEIGSEWELASRLHAVAPPPSHAFFPFALAEAGLTWYSQRGPFDDTTMRVVVGDDPWDFSLFYALRRLTGAAFWVPSNRLEDLQWVRELAGLTDRFDYGHEGLLRLCSVSDPALPAVLAGRIDEVASASKTQVVAWEQLLPILPRRQLCTGSPSFPEPLALEDEAEARSGLFPTPVPEIRSQRDPFDMHWMVDLHVDRWTTLCPSRRRAGGSRRTRIRLVQRASHRRRCRLPEPTGSRSRDRAVREPGGASAPPTADDPRPARGVASREWMALSIV
jgi:hypothetical protein